MAALRVLPPRATTARGAGRGPAVRQIHSVEECAASAFAHFGDVLPLHGWRSLLGRVRDGLLTMDDHCAQALDQARLTPQGTWEVYGHGEVGALSVGSFIADVEHDAFRLSRTLLGRLRLDQYRARAEDVGFDELLLRVPDDDQPAWTSMVHEVAAGRRPVADHHHHLVDRGAHRSPALTLAGLSQPLPGSGRPVVMGVVVTLARASRIGSSPVS